MIKEYIMKNIPKELESKSDFKRQCSDLYIKYQERINDLEDDWNEEKTTIAKIYKINIRNLKTTIASKTLTNKSADISHLSLSLDILKEEYTNEIRNTHQQLQIKKDKEEELAKKEFEELKYFFINGKKRLEKGTEEYIRQELQIESKKLARVRANLKEKIVIYNKSLNQFKLFKKTEQGKINKYKKILKAQKEGLEEAKKKAHFRLKVEERKLNKKYAKREIEIKEERKQFEIETQHQLDMMEREYDKVGKLYSKMERFFKHNKELEKEMRFFQRQEEKIKEEMNNVKRWSTGSLYEAKVFFNLYGEVFLKDVKKIYKDNCKKYHPDTNGARTLREQEECKQYYLDNKMYYDVLKDELKAI